MKKFLTAALALALLLSIGSTAAYAAGGVRGSRFVDEDNDGVCDWHDSSCQFVDADGDGVCDKPGSNGCGRGAGYTDADGDGVCDNFTACAPQNGSGLRRGHCGGCKK